MAQHDTAAGRELDAFVAAAAGADAPPRRLHPGRLILAVWGVVAGIWILLDQATKLLAVNVLEPTNRIVDLGFIQLRTIRNPGGAFGIPGVPGLFVVVSVVVLFLVIRALPHTDRISLAVAYGLVTGGAIGNVVDRITRVPGFPNGAVVDFFDLRWWPVFNVADIGIVTGAFAIAILMVQADREERAKESARSAQPSVRPDTAPPRR